MVDDPSLVRRRLDRVRRELIAPNRNRGSVPFDLTAWAVPDAADGGPGEPVPVAEALAATYQPIASGTAWGRPWGTTWFRLRATVPEDWAGEHVEAIVDLGFGRTGPGFMAEGLVWTPDPSGAYVPERGLHPAAHEWVISESATPGAEVALLVEAASNPFVAHGLPDPNSDRLTAATAPAYRIGTTALVVPAADVVALHHDLRVLVDLADGLDAGSTRAREIWVAIGRALDALDAGDVAGTAGAARAALAEVLARPAVSSAHRITAVGHAHIDSAWLWPIRETKRKCVRTFSNVLRRMEVDPDLTFVCSQAAQYDWIRAEYPTVFAQIAQRVAEGRWIPVGGNWVEADGNITGGESLVRQFVHGQRFFREHFGVTCHEQWIPDVFGYPASLPQLYRLAGAERFLTQKLSWNRTNRFPHHTFWWEGIDGSRVFTHFPPVDTYNASMLASELLHAERTFTEAGAASRSLMPFGFGDGGGGPNRDMAERYRRLRDLEGVPRLEMGSPTGFFDAAMAEYPDAPVWFGELYFEMHRGTYTSQARTKQGNRRCEALLREAEWWSVTAFGGSAADGYPAAELDRIWKEVLLLQFHDILPGSSIAWVHREAEEAYERLTAELEAIIGRALDALAGPEPVVANAAPHDRHEVTFVAEGTPVDGGQRLGDGRVAVVASAVAGGFGSLRAATLGSVSVEGLVADNGRLRVAVDRESGCVTSIRLADDGRELVAAGGRGGLPQLHHDLPFEFDAWDIEEHYRHQVTDLDVATTVEVLDDGPLVARIAVRHEFRSSTLTQTFGLRAGADQLDVEVDLDWHERDHLLKLAWPLDLLCCEVTRHIQYGLVRSAIHTNTSWDEARFEVCAHHWISAAEGDFGVALLSDSRYGYDATRTRGSDGRPSSTVRITAVKGARFPDPLADEGRHRFRYAVRPHGADLAPVLAAGYGMRHPLRVVPGRSGAPCTQDGTGGRTVPVVQSSHPGVVVEVVKAAEDASGDLVVRCYEALGNRTTATLSFRNPPEGLRVVDLLEDERDDLPAVPMAIDGATVTLTLTPFQIATLRLPRRSVGEM